MHKKYYCMQLGAIDIDIYHTAQSAHIYIVKVTFKKTLYLSMET